MCAFFFFMQKTAYEMRISDWSSDVCSSDLDLLLGVAGEEQQQLATLAPSSGASRHLLPLRRRRAAFRGLADYVPVGVLARNHFSIVARSQIGRASCRERVGQYG